jgi:alpha-methylacyl-CoA racemase
MGPLEGVTVVELGAIGPAPFCGMVLADLGARVIVVERPTAVAAPWPPLDLVLRRNRTSIAVDLGSEAGRSVLLRLVEGADALIEGYRPGVIERLGLSPQVLHDANPRLVIGRMTGWGQDGPLATRAGHDINYIALAGVLGSIGRAGEAPVPPLNLVGDFGGGGMLLAVGVLSALLSAARTGRGQVVDAAMVDGAAILTAVMHGMAAMGQWSDERGTNLLDGGAPFYDVYATADGGHLAVGAIEPQFFAALLDGLGIPVDEAPLQHDRQGWPALRALLTERILSRSLADWERVFDGIDACVTPVVAMSRAHAHPHNAARRTFVELDGIVQPAPAPRFSDTPTEVPAPAVRPGADTDAVLHEVGFSAEEIAALRATGAIAGPATAA